MRRAAIVLASLLIAADLAAGRAVADVTRDQVERAIRRGVDFLKAQQQADGSWIGTVGTTPLVCLALATAGVPVDSPELARGLASVARLDIHGGHETYALGLKAMALAVDPERHAGLLAEYAEKLARSQIRSMNRHTSGSWGYQEMPPGLGAGDNSNSQYALLGLHAASESGVKVEPEVWLRSRRYWESVQYRDGSWGYKTRQAGGGTGSMTCAGISSLVITGLKLNDSRERLVGDRVEHCGDRASDPALLEGLDWMATHFDVKGNINSGGLWKYYYLYGLERAGRLSGLRFFGRHDWYREGAEELVRLQDQVRGYWRGVGSESDPVLATSFALLFLAKGRSPVLVNKLKHGPGRDWDNDHDDLANLVGLVSRDWKALVTWQVVDPAWATAEDLMQAPILYINGHEPPTLPEDAKDAIRDYLARGGMILAESCCGRKGFDAGFRSLLREILPGPEDELHRLPPEHPIWRARYPIDPEAHPLWGIEHGCRTVVIYSPGDLSCSWQQMEAQPANPRVELGSRLGQNIVDYATGRELPADKLAARELGKVAVEVPRRGALRIAKLKHGGEWNIAPLAVPNLAATLRDKLKIDVVIAHKEVSADDPNLLNYPLLYVHGRGAISFNEPERARLRRHLSPGGGTLFADAACGSEAFDIAFRKVAAALYPDRPLEPIPPTDPFFSRPNGFDLADAQLNQAAGGARGYPQLEGVKVDGHWAIIYSRFDLGCALERHAGIDCKGYTHESAVRIAADIVLYATQP